jgi:hypothetical protein
MIGLAMPEKRGAGAAGSAAGSGGPGADAGEAGPAHERSSEAGLP